MDHLAKKDVAYAKQKGRLMEHNVEYPEILGGIRDRVVVVVVGAESVGLVRTLTTYT